MKYEEFMASLTHPWWCKGSPLVWMDEGIGPAHFALEGAVGMFNLSWLVLQRSEPPPADVYRNTDQRWIIMLAGGITIYNRTLLDHATFKTLPEFLAVIKKYTNDGRKVVADFPGNIPWATLAKLAERNYV